MKITIIGTGPVAGTLAALLGNRNKKLAEDQKVNLSILGRQFDVVNDEGIVTKRDSDSLAAIKENGVVLNYRLTSKSAELDRKIEITKDEILATADPQEILDKHGEQDVIIVATGVVSHDEKMLEVISSLRKPDTTSYQSTMVMMSHNGNTCWFLKKIPKPYPEEMKNDEHFLNEIGENNMLASVLNFSCNVAVKDGRTIPNEFNMATPLDKVEIPIAKIDSEIPDQLDEFLGIMIDAGKAAGCEKGITVQAREMTIEFDLLLKMQVNVAVNGICAITGKRIGEVMENEKLEKFVFALAQEFNNYSENIIGKPLRNSIKLRERLKDSKNHYPSMERNFSDGKPIEIKAIYQDWCLIAKKLCEKKIGCSFNTGIAEILTKMELARDQAIKNGDVLVEAVSQARVAVEADLEKLVSKANKLFRTRSNEKITNDENTGIPQTITDDENTGIPQTITDDENTGIPQTITSGKVVSPLKQHYKQH